MLELASALYLGFQHGQHQLPHWRQLSTGKPAALSEPAQARHIGDALARMQGLEAGLISPSTLHLFWDIFGILDSRRFVIFTDSHLYPVGQTGVERARGRGLPVIPFRHLCVGSLQQALRGSVLKGKRPVVVTDGWCPRCGKPAPLPAYQELIRPYNGLLVVDDTQALGILGERASRETPYGKRGGGTLKWMQIQGPHIVTISSLAKAFGVPLAVLCGSRKLIGLFRAKSTTRVSNSPVSNVHIMAAENALAVNRRWGDSRRSLLFQRVSFFRQSMARVGFPLTGGAFPVQSLPCPSRRYAFRLYRRLAAAGINSVLVAPHLDNRIALSFLIRANHRSSSLIKVSRVFEEWGARDFSTKKSRKNDSR